MSEENKSVVETKKELISSADFEKALTSAAEIKNEHIGNCKSRNKNNYSEFYELMSKSRTDIQSILDKKSSHRSDSEIEALKKFKKETSFTYNQVCSLLVPEDLEEGEDSKFTKLVSKIVATAKFLKYIGCNDLENEFKKHGYELKYESLDNHEMFGQEHIKEAITSIFTTGKNIKVDIENHNEEIKTNIYSNSVPTDLQYDKEMNPTGIKSSDFCKLVDLKAKLMKAESDEAKEKVEEIASNLAGDYEFANVRNKIIQTKLLEINNSEEE